MGALLLDWKNYLVLSLIAVCVFCVLKIKILTDELDESNKIIAEQMTKIAEFHAALEIANNEADNIRHKIELYAQEIKQRSSPIYRYLQNYKGDDNETSCESEISLIRSFNF